MSWHAFPSAPQIAHWYLKLTVPLPLQVPGFAGSVPPTLASKVIGVDPFQVPGLAVAVLPTVAAPLIVGGELFDGATVDRETTAPAAPTTTSPPTATSAATKRGDQFMRVPLSLAAVAVAVSLATAAAITAVASEVLTDS